MDAQIVDNPSEHRFELALGDATAVACYTAEDGRIVLIHTEVPQALSGRGIGSRLAQGVFEALRAKGRRVVARCPFMAAYASRQPDYAAMLDG